MTPRSEINPRTGESYNNVMAEIAREKHAATMKRLKQRAKEARE